MAGLKLTQGDKALLDALVYIDNGDIWNQASKTKLSEVVDELYKSPNGSSGGMTGDECKAILDAIKERPNLCQLELIPKEEIDYKQYSDARILTFKNGDETVVVFHGTGANEAEDNLKGAFESDTDAQKGALNYINQLHELGYGNISVIGHSKGGNKAMYVTALSDYVTDCTAFDAQGFSAAFHDKYSHQIKNKKNCITMISLDKSCVGAMLSSIAGTNHYLSSEGLSWKETELEPFPYHKPNSYFRYDENGNIISDENKDVQLREESTRAIIPDIIYLVTTMISAGFWGIQKGMEFLQIVVSEIINGTDPLALSVRIGGLLVAALPGLSEEVSGIFTSALKLFGVGDGIDVSRILTLAAAGWAAHAAATLISSVAGTLGIVSIATVLIKFIAAVIVVWAVTSFLEWAIPILIDAGIEAAKAIGLAVGMAASWIGEQLANIGKAVVDGFHKAIDGAVQLGKMAVDAAKAVKDAVSNALKSFLSDAGKFFDSIGKGAKSWIDGVFGSTSSAIQYAQNINVTMSRIEEMQRHISNLRQCYTNAKGTTNNASSTVNKVYSYYNESYVRSCCSDIQNNLKKAQNYINLAERELERKRKVLLTASESYRNADREAVGIVKSYT